MAESTAAWRFGESPFHANGLVYQGLLEYQDAHVAGGSAAVRDALDGELRAFYEQTFFASMQYDALPIEPITQVAATVAGVSFGELVRANARFVAGRDIRGVYKLLLNVLSPETVALRLPKASMRYFDFGKATAEMIAPRHCRIHQFGIPRALSGWFIAAVDGFAQVALGNAGARQPKLTAVSPQPDPRHPGTVVLRVDLTWE
jgi:hypothetical protein